MIALTYMGKLYLATSGYKFGTIQSASHIQLIDGGPDKGNLLYGIGDTPLSMEALGVVNSPVDTQKHNNLSSDRHRCVIITPGMNLMFLSINPKEDHIVSINHPVSKKEIIAGVHFVVSGHSINDSIFSYRAYMGDDFRDAMDNVNSYGLSQKTGFICIDPANWDKLYEKWAKREVVVFDRAFFKEDPEGLYEILKI